MLRYAPLPTSPPTQFERTFRQLHDRYYSLIEIEGNEKLNAYLAMVGAIAREALLRIQPGQSSGDVSDTLRTLIAEVIHSLPFRPQEQWLLKLTIDSMSTVITQLQNPPSEDSAIEITGSVRRRAEESDIQL